jgi:DNA-binding beta-propeller fold protein YncE
MKTLLKKLPHVEAQVAKAQLAFELGNPDAVNTIYITKDPKVNKLTLAITIDKGVGTLTPGKLVPKISAPSGTGSLLYLDLTALQLTTDEFNALVCTGEDWDFELFPDNFLIGMTPTVDMSLASGAGDAISISITGLVISNPPAVPNASLNVSSFRVDPVSSGKVPQVVFLKVLLQNAPGNKTNLNTALACELNSSADIFNSITGYDAVSNTISFLFKPGPVPATIPAGADTLFTVSFVYAEIWPGYGALTTPANAAKIKVRAGQNASDWKISQNADQQNPCWLLVPPKGIPIIGSGAKSVVQFEIEQIVTTFEPGPTLLFIQYQNVPGYNDGSYYIVLNKIPHVSIEELSISPNPAIVKNGKASVTITWKANNYKLLTLMPFYADVTQSDSYTVDLTVSKDITLVANGAGGPSNTVMKTITANVLPEINSFVATPNAIYTKDFPHEVKFYWDVDTNDSVYLVNVKDNIKEAVSKSSTVFKTVKTPGMWSIVPKSDTELFTLKRNVLIQAFSQEGRNQGTNFIPLKVVASPGAQFVAAINQAGNCVEILNSLTYDRYSDPIIISGKPVDIQFSAEGHYLFVADAAGNLTVVGVVYNSSKASYSFDVLTTITLDYTPVSIAVSPDTKFVFVSANATQDQQGHLLIIEQLSEILFAMRSDIPIGKNAGGLASDPTGALIYVTNTGSNSVSVIGYNGLTESFEFVRDITGMDTEPTDIAVADPLGSTLLVVCKGSNKLIVVNHDDRGKSTRQVLPLGTTPQYIDTTTSRAYAFITNKGSNNVTLVSCGGGIDKCKVLESGISTVKQPSGVSLSPDDAMVFVASSTEKSLTVLNLVNYVMQGAPVTVGTQPTDVVISSDNKYLVSWHNALIEGKGISNSKGLYIYDVAIGTVTSKMTTTEVIDCIYSPPIALKKLFVIAKDENNVLVLDGNTFGLQLKIPVPDNSSGKKRQPINISMASSGANLFLLTKDETGQYCSIVYSCDIGTNSYTVLTEIDLFVSKVKSNPVMLANTPDGSTAFVLDAYQGTLYALRKAANGAYKLDTKQPVIPSIPKSMVVSPDNSTLYILAESNLVTSYSIVAVKDLSVSKLSLAIHSTTSGGGANSSCTASLAFLLENTSANTWSPSYLSSIIFCSAAIACQV